MTTRPLALLFLVAALPAHASPYPTVAVMPFADLSGGRPQVGEAIRETVTSDLRGLGGLRVVERAQLEQILGEQRLQQRSLDVPGAVSVGRLVGASLIVTGAYQEAGANVRLTARFVKVETGEIVGTAKVDGAAADLLALQDRVTTQLARSAGLVFAPRRRPRLRSLHVVETYGDAVVERDPERRYRLLHAAVSEDPEFDYAVRDLGALEKRIEEYSARAERERQRVGQKRVEALRAEARAARGEQAIVAAWEALFRELHAQLRFKRLTEEAAALLARPPLPAQTELGARLDERARFEHLLGLAILKTDTDGLLREGERFLARYPTSRHFDDVKQIMQYAIRWKRKAEAGPGDAASRIARLPPERRDDPCVLGRIYHEERQLQKAAADYERCVADPRSDQSTLMNLINVYIAIPDFRSARRALALLRTRFPGVADGPQGEAYRELPIDAD